MTESRANTGPSSGRRSHSLDDVRETYADQADQMDRFRWLNHLFTGRYRQRLFGRAQGRVLDVACGTGLNARYLPDATTYVGIDASPDMLTKARHRVGAWDRVEGLYEMDAQALEFPDDSFDTVVSSLSTCTFPDPVAALNEMARVCKPEAASFCSNTGGAPSARSRGSRTGGRTPTTRNTAVGGTRSRSRSSKEPTSWSTTHRRRCSVSSPPSRPRRPGDTTVGRIAETR